MGLHSPFGYVGYEIQLGRILMACLDNLCAHCHTNGDYDKGCRDCPAGNLIFECRDYLLSTDESDKRYEMYASEEWAQKSARPIDEFEQQRDLKVAEEYKPECDLLRGLKSMIPRIRPRPFYYVRKRKGGFRRPKALADFAELLEKYDELYTKRIQELLGKLEEKGEEANAKPTGE